MMSDLNPPISYPPTDPWSADFCPCRVPADRDRDISRGRQHRAVAVDPVGHDARQPAVANGDGGDLAHRRLNMISVGNAPLRVRLVALMPKAAPHRRRIRSTSAFNCMVPLAGLEPARCFHHLILSQARLPIPPQGQAAGIIPAAAARSTPKCRFARRSANATGGRGGRTHPGQRLGRTPRCGCAIGPVTPRLRSDMVRRRSGAIKIWSR